MTGGAGFIGSHVVERLVNEGHHVRVIDNLTSGNLDNLEHLRSEPRLTFQRCDVADFKSIADLFIGVDWVFHLAALADIVPSIENPLTYHRSNVDGTVAVLEAARAGQAQRFIYAASSSCYGIADQFPTPESAPIRLEYPYALTKYLGEQQAMHWHHVYGLPCVSLRFFNVYGPRARTNGNYGAVFGVFLAQKLAGNPYTLVGDGSQSRDFTYVADVVDAAIQAAASNVGGAVYNVGSGATHTINELVSLLGGPVVHIAKRPGEPDCTFADITKIRRALGWRPKVTFQQGVAAMLEHIEQWRDAPVWDEQSIAGATAQWFEHLGDKPSRHVETEAALAS